MHPKFTSAAGTALLTFLLVAGATALEARAQSAEEIAKALQDPLANIKAIMTDNAINLNSGTLDERTGYNFQIQPVYAMPSERFIFIPRAVIPIVGAPRGAEVSRTRSPARRRRRHHLGSQRHHGPDLLQPPLGFGVEIRHRATDLSRDAHGRRGRRPGLGRGHLRGPRGQHRADRDRDPRQPALGRGGRLQRVHLPALAVLGHPRSARGDDPLQQLDHRRLADRVRARNGRSRWAWG